MFSNHKYCLKTNQFSAGRLGGTVLDILARVQRADPAACFGFIGAAMLGEDESQGTRRFWMYLKMLRLKLDPNLFTVTGDYETSSIFVFPVLLPQQPDLVDSIKKCYERYFRENF